MDGRGRTLASLSPTKSLGPHGPISVWQKNSCLLHSPSGGKGDSSQTLWRLASKKAQRRDLYGGCWLCSGRSFSFVSPGHLGAMSLPIQGHSVTMREQSLWQASPLAAPSLQRGHYAVTVEAWLLYDGGKRQCSPSADSRASHTRNLYSKYLLTACSMSGTRLELGEGNEEYRQSLFTVQ